MAQAVWQTSRHSIPSPVSPPKNLSPQNPTHQSLVQLQHHAHPPQSSPSAPSDQGRAYTQPYPTENISGHSILRSHVPFQPPNPPPSDSRREPSFGNDQSVLRPPPPPSEHGHGYIQSSHEPWLTESIEHSIAKQSHAPYPPQHPPPSMDGRREPSFDNGQSALTLQPLQQQGHAPCPPPPPAPLHDNKLYASLPTHMYPAPQGGQDYSPYGAPPAEKQQPKPQRASQACDRCRHLKAKCDEQKPCKNCNEKNEQCNYREPIVKQQDKVLEAVQTIDSTLKALSDRLAVLEDAIGGIAAAQGIGLPAIPKAVKVEQSRSEDAVSNVQASPNSGRGELADESLGVAPPTEEPIPLLMDDDGPIPPGSPIPVGKPAITLRTPCSAPPLFGTQK